MPPAAQDRRGFTLVELLVVAVIGAFVLTGMYNVVITNQRAFTVHSAEVSTQQTVRAGLAVMLGELREVSTAGDLIVAGSDSIQIRSMERLGLVCALDYPLSRLTLRRVGDWFENGDSVFVFADNNPSSRADDVWLIGTVQTVDTTTACPDGSAAQNLSVPSMAAAMSVDSVRMGAPVRSFERYTYGLADIGSGFGWFLSRWQPGSPVEPLIGPLQGPAQDGLEFEYFDENGAATFVAADARQVRVTLRTDSPVTKQTGGYVGDSISARVFLRN